jgi:hypothetical protein
MGYRYIQTGIFAGKYNNKKRIGTMEIVSIEEMTFALPFSHRSGVTNSLVPMDLSSPSTEIFTMMVAFPSRFLSADLLM